MAIFTGINPFFITHRYNTPLLDYNIAAADGMEDRGARCNNSGYECCGRKEERNNRKEYHSTSKARKVRSEIVALYCNILKVSQVLAFSTLGRYSFPFYRRMEGAPRLTYGTTKVHSLYPIFQPLPLPRASVTLSYPAKGIKADTPLAKYHHAVIFNTLVPGRSARGPCADVEGAIPRAGPSLGG